MIARTKSNGTRQGKSNKLCVVATNATYAKLCQKSLRRLPTHDRAKFDIHSFASFADVKLPSQTSGKTVIISRLSDLPKEGSKVIRRPQAKHLLFLEGLPIEAMASRLTQLDIRTPQRLHVAPQRSSEHIADLVYRLFSGMTNRNGSQPIVDAWIEDEQLVLLSAAFERLTVPLEKLSKIVGTAKKKVGAFEIDEDGQFLYWPHADAHLGWDQLLQITDPTAALAAQQRSKAFNGQYGAAIRALRESHGLKQSDIQNVTERHLRRVEHGEQVASKAVLQSLAEAVGISLEECMKELASRIGGQD